VPRFLMNALIWEILPSSARRVATAFDQRLGSADRPVLERRVPTELSPTAALWGQRDILDSEQERHRLSRPWMPNSLLADPPVTFETKRPPDASCSERGIQRDRRTTLIQFRGWTRCRLRSADL